MAELDAETLRELRKIKTAANLQNQAAQLSTPQGMQSYLEGIQSQLSGMKTSATDKTAAEANIAAIQADKAAAAKAKADAQKTLMEVTGALTPAGAVAAAAAGNVSRNPNVVQAKKDLAAAQQKLLDLQLLAARSGGGGGGGGDGTKSTKQTYTAPDGRIFTDLDEYNAYVTKLKQDEKTRQGQSAYDLLYQQFNAMGLGALVDPLKSFIIEGLSPAEFTLRLRDTDAYKKRFAANAARINKGLRALSEAEYINLEDQYQSVMRNYGLPASYYARGDMGRQEGFEKFIGFDVSPAELEDRIQTAYNRVINAAPEVSQALKTFYPDITNSDILAYSLDPEKALTEIRRKVTAAEIGGAALGAGLATDVARAEQLGRYGITGAAAQQGYQTIAGGLERGRQLSGLYQQPEYTQKTAEQEVFNLAGGAEAARERRKLTKLEQATFGGQTGMTGGALARDRAGTF